MKPTYYQILGIREDAPDRDIRNAYRKLVLEYHPDRNPDPKAADKFIEIREAYEMLIEPEKRKGYDQVLRMMRAKAMQEAVKSVPKAKPPEPRPAPAKTKPTPKPVVDPQDLMRMTQLLQKGKIADAEAVARKVISIDSKQPTPYAVLGDVHRFRGELKKAAEMYAYAAQFSPGNSIYQRKHEEVLAAMRTDAMVTSVRTGTPDTVGIGFVVGMIVIVVAAAYLALSQERPLFPGFAPLSTWTLGLFMSLLVSGVGMGAGLALSGQLDGFLVVHGSAVSKISPASLLGLMSAICFWAAAGLYFVVGVVQGTFNLSLSRALAAAGGITVFMTLASWVNGRIEPFQVFLVGGNVVYMGILAGWMVGEAFRE